MMFKDALNSLLEGKYVTRNAWDETGEYVCLMPGMPYIWKILIKPSPNAGNWLPMVSDFLADDYKFVDPKDVHAQPAPPVTES